MDGGDVLIVGGHPLESGVCPPHDKPDVGIQCAHLGVDIDVEGDNIQTKCHSSEHSVGKIIKSILKVFKEYKSYSLDLLSTLPVAELSCWS